ncbi:peptidylprolyl isomerase [Fulvitalea axinellae]|uniref:Peptidylprolyl isomerase n=1 Tax=Fulvitalea axinellae TaxID=1182444 RepID=A0AAU9DIQ5_9BACT|nr:peptidylprolyl isomerase [Fulvitalea axinellae]
MSLRFSILSKAVFALLMVGTGLFGTAKAQLSSDVVADRIVAKVDSRIILQSDLERAYLNYLQQSSGYGNLTKCNILEKLIIDKVMVSKAEIDSILVSEEEVNLDLDNRLQMMVQQIGSEEAIEQYYGKTLDDFREELYDPIYEDKVKQKMQKEIVGAIKVTPAEIQVFYDKIPRDSLPMYSTEVEVAQIVKKPILNETEKDRVEQLLFDLRKRIQSGEAKFEDLARLHSIDPGSAANGGDLGWVKRGVFVPEFEAVAMTMKENEISDPVESDFGFHLIQLLERRGNEFHARHILVKPKFVESDFEAAEKELDSLRTLIVADSMKFENVAKDVSEDKRTAGSGGYMTNGTDGTLISVEQVDPEIFFTLDTMKVGSVTKPLRFKMADGTDAVRLLYFKRRVDPHVANMQDDYQKLSEVTLNSKINDAMHQWFLKAKEDVFIEVNPDYRDCDILKD